MREAVIAREAVSLQQREKLSKIKNLEIKTMSFCTP